MDSLKNYGNMNLKNNAWNAKDGGIILKKKAH